jgi:cyclopropane fatty-acyl-phospholipid synthase-like methyltransferase
VAAGAREKVTSAFPGSAWSRLRWNSSLGRHAPATRVLGQDYAETLAIWRNNFRQLWKYQFAYCEVDFLSGNIDVRQVAFGKSK